MNPYKLFIKQKTEVPTNYSKKLESFINGFKPRLKRGQTNGQGNKEKNKSQLYNNLSSESEEETLNKSFNFFDAIRMKETQKHKKIIQFNILLKNKILETKKDIFFELKETFEENSPRINKQENSRRKSYFYRGPNFFEFLQAGVDVNSSFSSCSKKIYSNKIENDKKNITRRTSIFGNNQDDLLGKDFKMLDSSFHSGKKILEENSQLSQKSQTHKKLSAQFSDNFKISLKCKQRKSDQESLDDSDLISKSQASETMKSQKSQKKIYENRTNILNNKSCKNSNSIKNKIISNDSMIQSYNKLKEFQKFDLETKTKKNLNKKNNRETHKKDPIICSSSSIQKTGSRDFKETNNELNNKLIIKEISLERKNRLFFVNEIEIPNPRSASSLFENYEEEVKDYKYENQYMNNEESFKSNNRSTKKIIQINSVKKVEDESINPSDIQIFINNRDNSYDEQKEMDKNQKFLQKFYKLNREDAKIKQDLLMKKTDEYNIDLLNDDFGEKILLRSENEKIDSFDYKIAQAVKNDQNKKFNVTNPKSELQNNKSIDAKADIKKYVFVDQDLNKMESNDRYYKNVDNFELDSYHFKSKINLYANIRSENFCDNKFGKKSHCSNQLIDNNSESKLTEFSQSESQTKNFHKNDYSDSKIAKFDLQENTKTKENNNKKSVKKKIKLNIQKVLKTKVSKTKNKINNKSNLLVRKNLEKSKNYKEKEIKQIKTKTDLSKTHSVISLGESNSIQINDSDSESFDWEVSSKKTKNFNEFKKANNANIDELDLESDFCRLQTVNGSKLNSKKKIKKISKGDTKKSNVKAKIIPLKTTIKNKKLNLKDIKKVSTTIPKNNMERISKIKKTHDNPLSSRGVIKKSQTSSTKKKEEKKIIPQSSSKIYKKYPQKVINNTSNRKMSFEQSNKLISKNNKKQTQLQNKEKTQRNIKEIELKNQNFKKKNIIFKDTIKNNVKKNKIKSEKKSSNKFNQEISKEKVCSDFVQIIEKIITFKSKETFLICLKALKKKENRKMTNKYYSLFESYSKLCFLESLKKLKNHFNKRNVLLKNTFNYCSFKQRINMKKFFKILYDYKNQSKRNNLLNKFIQKKNLLKKDNFDERFYCFENLEKEYLLKIQSVNEK